MDITVRSTGSYETSRRDWLWGPHGTEPGSNPNITLDLTTFTKATHYPKGWIDTGVVVGQITATKLYGPYDPAATDGRQTPKGLTYGAINVRDGQTRAITGILVHGFVMPGKLPIKTGAGSLPVADQPKLPLIHFMDEG